MPEEQRYTVLFSIPFHAEMTEPTKRLLEVELNLTMNWEPKVTSAVQAPGFARLDFASGLYLLPAGGDDAWVLECRTFQQPPSEVVHRWRATAGDVAHSIDPAVPVMAARAPKPVSAARPHRRGRLGRRRTHDR